MPPNHSRKSEEGSRRSSIESLQQGENNSSILYFTANIASMAGRADGHRPDHSRNATVEVAAGTTERKVLAKSKREQASRAPATCNLDTFS
eukprot:6210649-Pleurochrysis_carterae.AAC.13